MLSYAAAPVAVAALRRSAPGMSRPFRVRALAVLGPLSFIVAALIVYWSRWETLSWLLGLQVVMFAGYVLYRLPSREGRAQLLRQVQCSAWLIAFYLMVMLVSYLGSFGGIGAIAHPWDTLAVAVPTPCMMGRARIAPRTRAGRRRRLRTTAARGRKGGGEMGKTRSWCWRCARAGWRRRRCWPAIAPGGPARTVDRADPRRLAGHVVGRRPQDDSGGFFSAMTRWLTQSAGLRSCRIARALAAAGGGEHAPTQLPFDSSGSRTTARRSRSPRTRRAGAARWPAAWRRCRHGRDITRLRRGARLAVPADNQPRRSPDGRHEALVEDGRVLVRRTIMHRVPCRGRRRRRSTIRRPSHGPQFARLALPGAPGRPPRGGARRAAH